MLALCAPRSFFVVGHGYSLVPATADALETADGGPLSYLVHCRAALWRIGGDPRLATPVLESDPRFSV